MSTAETVIVDLFRSRTMSPIASTQASDFGGEPTAPYTPDRQLVDAATNTVILTLMVEGLGGINDYSVRIELPAFDDYLKAVAQIVYSVHAAAFAVNWEPEPMDDDEQ